MYWEEIMKIGPAEQIIVIPIGVHLIYQKTLIGVKNPSIVAENALAMPVKIKTKKY